MSRPSESEARRVALTSSHSCLRQAHEGEGCAPHLFSFPSSVRPASIRTLEGPNPPVRCMLGSFVSVLGAAYSVAS